MTHPDCYASIMPEPGTGVMMPCPTGRFSNAPSSEHRYGHDAATAIESVRE